MKPDTIKEIVINLAKSESEGTFYEFKVDYHEPEKIGEYISALSNSALLADEQYGYLIYGIQDKTHEIVGTKFNPRAEKGKGNEDLEPWLRRLLTPRIGFEIIDLQIDGKRIVVFQIPAAESQPTSFKSTRYVRINSYNKIIGEFPDLEKKLWKKLEKRIFESEIAYENIPIEDIGEHIFTDDVFKYLDIKIPDTLDGIVEKLIEEGFIVQTGRTYSLTNLGAILFAKKLDRYPHLSRKKLRIISYNSSDRIYAKDEW
ncbi:MAG: putative DNA binding domain-containing protein [Methanomicrobium sp.]|nr:putative DNA binding domain-containing protein [Methanomicrobium sp.]